ncbi:hypothetical protein FIBSPDRAFT_533166 [Athelia psychrophila]|uniref:Uncharacterized protein n=1 Tax=Athelia psychrophila TaxID=1759441 RepID=A0A166JAF1_9AGAM|nr:hypothetical protein FIBSPDRAFT_533166 [Fibularhizoctonia sp. CBS 109695]
MPIPLASSEVETALPYELQIASYVALVVLTVRRGSVTFGGGLGKCSLIHQQSYTWDWILSIPEEYEILQSVGLNRPIAVYYLSRIFSLCYCVSECTRDFDPSIAPGGMTWVKFLLWWLSGSATSLLFLFRIMAVFYRSNLVKLGFTILWLSWLLSPVAVLFGSGHTCLTNDTLVFLSISYRMAVNAMTTETWVARSRSFITGEGLYRISKVLLYSGQLYYG